MFTKTKKSK